MAIPDCCSNLKCLTSASQDEARSILSQKGGRFSQRKGRTKVLWDFLT